MSNTVIKVLFVLLVGTFMLGPSTYGQQLKVGYMNPQTVLDTLPAKQKVEKQLSGYIERVRGQLKQQTMTFQRRISKLQQQAQNASGARQQQLQDSVRALNQRLQNYRMQVQKQIQRRRAKMLRPIYNRIDKAIQAVAERRNLEFVLNEKTSQGQHIISYAEAKQLNITDEVIDKLLNKEQ